MLLWTQSLAIWAMELRPRPHRSAIKRLLTRVMKIEKLLQKFQVVLKLLQITIRKGNLEYMLFKSKRHSLRCHDFLVHAYLLLMCTNVVDFRVMRRLCRREWNWQSVNQHSGDMWQWTTWSRRVTSDFNSVLVMLEVPHIPKINGKSF